MNRFVAENAKSLLDALVDPEGFTSTLRESSPGDWRLDLMSYGASMPDWDAGGVICFLAGYVDSRMQKDA